MFKWERRLYDTVEKHVLWVAAGAVLLLSLYARYRFWPLMNTDLVAMGKWVDAAREGGMRGMLAQIDYSAVYCYLFYLLSKLPLPLTTYGEIKLLFVGFEYLCIGACSLLVWRLSQKHKDRNAFAVFSLLCLSPVMVLNAAAWGQCDAMYTLFIVLSILLLIDRRTAWAFVVYGVALSLKLQAIFVLPAFLLVWFMRREKSILYFLILPAVVWLIGLPLAFFGGGLFFSFAEYTKHGASQLFWATKNYPGFYALFGALLDPFQVKEEAQLYMFMGYGAALCLGSLTAMYAVLVRRKTELSGQTLPLLFAWTALVAVFTMPYMHERYGMAGEVLLLCYAVLRGRPAGYAAWVASTAAIVAAYSGFLLQNAIIPQQIGAFVNLGVLAFLTVELLSAAPAAEGGRLPAA